MTCRPPAAVLSRRVRSDRNGLTVGGGSAVAEPPDFFSLQMTGARPPEAKRRFRAPLTGEPSLATHLVLCYDISQRLIHQDAGQKVGLG